MNSRQNAGMFRHSKNMKTEKMRKLSRNVKCRRELLLIKCKMIKLKAFKAQQKSFKQVWNIFLFWNPKKLIKSLHWHSLVKLWEIFWRKLQMNTRTFWEIYWISLSSQMCIFSFRYLIVCRTILELELSFWKLFRIPRMMNFNLLRMKLTHPSLGK